MDLARINTSVMQAVLKSHRELGTISLREFARRSGYSASLFSRMGSGDKTVVLLKTARAVAEVFGIPEELLIEEVFPYA